MAMKGKSIPVDSERNIYQATRPNPNVNTLTQKVRGAVEYELRERYGRFSAVSYLKIDGNYIVKINVGYKCVHAKFLIRGINPQLIDLQNGMTMDSPLRDF